MRLAIVCALLASILTLAGCESDRHPTPTPTATATTLEQLIAILQNPESPDFWFATTELAEMGPAAAPAAKILAKALGYPRRDSYMAGIALASMGPAAGPATPELVQSLENDRSEVRLFAAVVLGTIGPSAKCAAPKLALQLWDTDPWVRTAAAAALDAITGIDLVVEVYEISPAAPGSVAGDEPEGYITGKARAWWIGEGQYLDWAGESDFCKSGSP